MAALALRWRCEQKAVLFSGRGEPRSGGIDPRDDFIEKSRAWRSTGDVDVEWAIAID